MVRSGNQISRLISPCPQPASRKTADSKAADVIKVLKIFNRYLPADENQAGKRSMPILFPTIRFHRRIMFHICIMMVETSQ